MAEWKERSKLRVLNVGIVGAMGSGKTTLSEVLTERWRGSEKLTEKFEENPYLTDFYLKPKQLSFRSQMWFLANAVEQRSNGLNGHAEVMVEDPAVVSNFTFARAQFEIGWMTGKEWSAYKNLYGIFEQTGKIQPCDFTIFLKTDPKVLIERVAGRGRDFENVTMAYMETLNESVLEIAGDYRDTGYPSMILDSTRNDFRSGSGHAGLLVERTIAEYKLRGGFAENVLVPRFG